MAIKGSTNHLSMVSSASLERLDKLIIGRVQRLSCCPFHGFFHYSVFFAYRLNSNFIYVYVHLVLLIWMILANLAGNWITYRMLMKEWTCFIYTPWEDRVTRLCIKVNLFPLCIPIKSAFAFCICVMYCVKYCIFKSVIQKKIF